jgi:hypothetical protein
MPVVFGGKAGAAGAVSMKKDKPEATPILPDFAKIVTVSKCG